MKCRSVARLTEVSTQRTQRKKSPGVLCGHNVPNTDTQELWHETRSGRCGVQAATAAATAATAAAAHETRGTDRGGLRSKSAGKMSAPFLLLRPNRLSYFDKTCRMFVFSPPPHAIPQTPCAHVEQLIRRSAVPMQQSSATPMSPPQPPQPPQPQHAYHHMPEGMSNVSERESLVVLIACIVESL